MQAIILAAGMGKRLGNLTLNNSKCMVKVNGIPLIERMLRQLDRLHLDKIVLVIGYEGEKLQTFIDSLPLATKVEYVTNEIYDKTNNIYSLYLAKDYMLESDILLLEADLVFEDLLLTKLINDPYPDLALVARYESWMDGTCVTLDENNNILRFIPKKIFSFDEISNYYKTVNIYKFSKQFLTDQYVPFLEAYMKAAGLNDYYEQVLRMITYLDNPGLKALPLKGEKWYEIDNLEDLNIAESVIGSESERLTNIESRKGGFWRFNGMLDFTHSLNPHFPGRKMLSEIRVNSDVLIKEYPSRAEVIRLLAAKYFNVEYEYVCVGNGTAEIINRLLCILQGKIGIVYPGTYDCIDIENHKNLVPFTLSPGNPVYTSQDLINYFSSKSISHLFIANPDNFSGNFLQNSELLSLIEWSRDSGISLVVDISCSAISEGNEGNNLLFRNQMLEQNSNLAVIHSFSRTAGIPGLRISVAGSANKDLVRELTDSIPFRNINSFAEFYLQITGKYESDYVNSCRKFIEERRRFYKDLVKINFLHVYPSHADFFLCEVKPPFSSDSLTGLLLHDYDILVGSLPEIKILSEKNFIQIAVRKKEDNERLIEVFNKLEDVKKLV
jgi:choline kinase/histidinol-phosphate/aromatic aminotransferase/cobyric acid decarboxylase-like protein